MLRVVYLLFLPLGAALPSATAQTLFIAKDQQLYVANRTSVSVSGSLKNQGTLTNNGSILVSGDWTNEQTFTSGSTSQVTLSGTETQQIDAGGSAFNQLTIRGGGSKLLISEARVRDTLRLTNGILVPQPPAAPLVLTASASVAGGSDASYVAEQMQHQGNGPLVFPLGLSGQYTPLTLTEVTGDAPTLRVRVVAPSPPATPGDQLERVSTARYWEITATEGRWESATATLSVTTEDGFDELVGVVVAQSDRGGGVFTNRGQADRLGNAADGSVTAAQPITQPVVALALTTEFSVPNQVEVPSAFAPNAPNPVNRRLKVYAATLLPEAFSFRIFDRWGTLVYQTTSLAQARDEGWNGLRQSDQSPAPPGVYPYHVRGLFENNVPAEQSGTITLFR